MILSNSKKGLNRFLVKIPKELIQEIIETSEPSNRSILKPSFVFDFLSCKIGKNWKGEEILIVKGKDDFCWVEVKSGQRELSPNQIRVSRLVSIPLYRFRVANPLDPPRDVTIYWDKVDEDYLKRFDS